jgi:tripartite-type tricarboxylate transporter receptor subunit TctC
VPYRGGAQAVQDLVAGQIDMVINDPVGTLEQVRSGNVKAYAVMAKTRLDAASDIPTVDEAGLPGFYASIWHGLWVPKGTPKQVIGKLNAEVVDALADSMARQRLSDLGQEIFPREQQTPEALGAHQRGRFCRRAGR